MKTVIEAFHIAFKTTAWFETSGKLFTLSVGNFDKQGLSWGPRQNCIGQGSLQPLMRRMLTDDPAGLATALGPLLASFQDVARPRPTGEQLAIVVGQWNDDRGRLKPEWTAAFERLGALPTVQTIFMDSAMESVSAVDVLAKWIAGSDPVTVRAWAVAYDFVTQNGGFHPAFMVAISAFLLALAPFRKDPRDRMRAICWLRAGWTYIRGQRQFADDVLGRKLLLVEGSGKFRGEFVDVDDLYGISDEAVS